MLHLDTRNKQNEKPHNNRETKQNGKILNILNRTQFATPKKKQNELMKCTCVCVCVNNTYFHADDEILVYSLLIKCRFFSLSQRSLKLCAIQWHFADKISQWTEKMWIWKTHQHLINVGENNRIHWPKYHMFMYVIYSKHLHM